jgi:hypothetical protein
MSALEQLTLLSELIILSHTRIEEAGIWQPNAAHGSQHTAR